jgi:hypothetical protein
MGHFIGTIKEQIGEREHDTSFLFQSTRPEGTMNRIAREWYGKADNPKGEDGGYYFDGGEIHVKAHGCKKINADDYATIKRVGALVELR